MNSADFVIA